MSMQTSGLALSRIGTDADWPLSQNTRQPARRSHADTATGIDIELVRTRAGFDALEPEWNALFDRAGRSDQMFQTHAWLWHWANHFLPSDSTSLAIVTLRKDGRLVGIVPLTVQRVLGLRQLEFMGAPVSQYGDALIEDLPQTDLLLSNAILVAACETDAHLARFAKVRDDAAIAGALARLNAQVTGSEEAPYIDLAKAKSFQAYDERFSSKARKNRRRLERRLAEHGPITPDWPSGTESAHAAEATMSLKRAWLKARGQLSKAFADRRTDAFFADVCAGRGRSCGGEVSVLRSGGEIANAAILINVKGRQALHIVSLNMKFEKCAAGILHIEKLIQRAFETNAATFDFLAPRHAYKDEWADTAVHVRDQVIPVTMGGRVYTRVYLGYVREKLKAGFKQKPAWLVGPISLIQSTVRRVRG